MSDRAENEIINGIVYCGRCRGTGKVLCPPFFGTEYVVGDCPQCRGVGKWPVGAQGQEEQGC